MTPARSDIQEIYRRSKKRVDINWFTEWACRPVAAVIVYYAKPTRVTPNQLTFASTALCTLAALLFAATTSYFALFLAAVIFHISFLFDCADGMLARERKIASPLGHYLDFMMDEIKAVMVFAAVTWRLFDATWDRDIVVMGLFSLLCLSSGLTMTAFVRREEYSGTRPGDDGQPAQMGSRTGPMGQALNLAEHAARWVVHYPQYLWFCALIDRLDIYFWAYGAVNILYALKTLAAIGWRLGR